MSFDEEMERARPRIPFSNGFEFESWSSIWCDECIHEETCPLLLVILHEVTPGAWDDVNPSALNRYHCQEFVGREDPTVPIEGDPRTPQVGA